MGEWWSEQGIYNLNVTALQAMRNSSDDGGLNTNTLHQKLELTAAHSLAAPARVSEQDVLQSFHHSSHNAFPTSFSLAKLGGTPIRPRSLQPSPSLVVTKMFPPSNAL